ncbi:hypothetical protein HHX38_15425 [Streptomyces sp. PKU-MA01144]|uniref:hypothetical protein n=1 Tax=Streptomyces sp. PKU-MA01144 TaxID=2729138 RepID=UPI00147E617E|nr:hypothetical protein [Streptomyces sp. PKU-MA01144]NNJ05518.1 hypothetical protein [Streptomyces sp. PKU-MA01144]
MGEPEVPCGIVAGPRAGVDQHRRVLAGVGEQQVHRVSAHRHGPLQIGDAPSGQVPLQAVGEVLARLAHRTGRAGLDRGAAVARS